MEAPLRTSRIVASYRLRMLGSVCSLLCGEKHCENDTQSFSLRFQIRTVAVFHRKRANKKVAPPKQKAPDWVLFVLERVDRKDAEGFQIRMFFAEIQITVPKPLPSERK